MNNLINNLYNKNYMQILEGMGITSVSGIYCLGENIGIKSAKKDFAVIYSERLANAVGVFTKNEIKGAPVIVSTKKLKSGKAQAIIINSGISNVCTGEQGIKDAVETARLGGEELGIPEEYVLVSSTGLIGAYLPMDKIRVGIKGIKDRLSKNSMAPAEAILTTDTKLKQIAIRIDKVTIAGIAKGAGMINPNMATMLVFIMSDAEIDSKYLGKMLKNSVDKSFNMITIDNDTSTSDSVFLFANGIAGKISYSKFQEGLDFVCKELAKLIARDGEGATKLIEVIVKNARTETQAKKIAKSIAGSNLFKSAMFGSDPNWGRIMSAVGYSYTNITQNSIDVYINKDKIVSGGVGVNFDREKISNLLKSDKVQITVDLHLGIKSAVAYGCDLTYDYVKINAQYHT
ncbi:MAG: bifunctional glutamate N-acetyltransferase/amino-acid acetyltransferase ArgJ [Nanoarchaeota archaeon]